MFKKSGPSLLRRALPVVLGLLAAFAPAARAENPPKPSAPRPNVVLIIGDDHASYVYGAYGNARAKTPNLDRLAGQGMRFTRAWPATPVCTASRAAFITGRSPAEMGVTRLSSALPESEVTLADALLGAGYATAAFGKMHFNAPARPGLHGFERLFEVDEANRESARRAALATKAGPPGETDQSGPAGEHDPGPGPFQPPWRPFKDPASVWLNSACLPVARRLADMPGSVIADEATAYLRERAEPANRDKPFFMIASFPEPHSPFNFPVEYRGMFDLAQFKTEPGAPPDVDELSPEDRAQIPAVFRDLTAEQKRGVVAAYYTAAAFLDHCVGRTLDELDRLGLADNTLVIYLGDHGYMLGQRGRFEKHCMWAPALAAPLVARWPGRVAPGSVSDALVEFIDIFPTVAGVCGAEVPAAVEGRDLGPILRGETRAGRETIFSAYHQNEEAALSDGHYKLIYGTGLRDRDDGYRTGAPPPYGRSVLLFDIERDPGERVNLLAARGGDAGGGSAGVAAPKHPSAPADLIARADAMKREMLRRLSGGRADPDSALGLDAELDKWLVPVESRATDPRWTK